MVVVAAAAAAGTCDVWGFISDVVAATCLEKFAVRVVAIRVLGLGCYLGLDRGLIGLGDDVAYLPTLVFGGVM